MPVSYTHLLYRWDEMKKDGYNWWVQRVRNLLENVDYVRLDHFRGFAAYWEIPAEEETAVKGRWVEGPGENFFTVLKAELGSLPIIAEDVYKRQGSNWLPLQRIISLIAVS